MREETQNEYEKAVNRVVDYIAANLFSVPSIREIAEVSNISGFHFHRIFKAIIGENIGEFINRLRMEEIASKLLMTNSKISDIAIETGYETINAFSRAFKNYYGITPTCYRGQAKNLHPFFGDTNEYALLDLQSEIRIVPAKTIVYIRIIDVYGAEKSFAAAWDKLRRFAQSKKLIDDNVEFIGLSFDDPAITSPEKCRFYACFTPNREVKPEGSFGVRTIPGGKYAVFLHNGPYYKLKETYFNIYVKWFPESGLKIKGNMSFEKYLNNSSETKDEELRTEIYVPVSGGTYHLKENNKI